METAGFWLNGTFYPLIMGGAEDGEGGDDDKGDKGDGKGETGDAGDGDGSKGDGEGDGDDEGTKSKPKPKYSQDDMDSAITKRVARERKKWEKDQAEAKKKEQMTEAEKLKAAKDEAEAKAAESQTIANKKLVRADAKVAAVAAGVKAERVNRFLKLVDLSDVDVDDKTGEPDSDAIKAAITEALEDVPEFKAGDGKGGESGGDFSSSGSGKKWSQAEVDKLSPEEYEKHRDEIMAQVRAGTIK